MQIGVGVQKGTDNRNYVILEAIVENAKIQISLTDQDNYEHDLDALISGLTQMKKDMAFAATGLTLAKEIPNGLRPSQGGSKPGTRSTSKSRSRPPTR